MAAVAKNIWAGWPPIHTALNRLQKKKARSRFAQALPRDTRCTRKLWGQNTTSYASGIAKLLFLWEFLFGLPQLLQHSCARSSYNNISGFTPSICFHPMNAAYKKGKDLSHIACFQLYWCWKRSDDGDDEKKSNSITNATKKGVFTSLDSS